MADLIEKELQSFSEPKEVNFILVLNTFFLKLGIRLIRGVQSHRPLVLNSCIEYVEHGYRNLYN